MVKEYEGNMKLFFIVIATGLFAANTFTSIMAYRRGDLEHGPAAASTTIGSCLTVLGIAAMILP